MKTNTSKTSEILVLWIIQVKVHSVLHLKVWTEYGELFKKLFEHKQGKLINSNSEHVWNVLFFQSIAFELLVFPEDYDWKCSMSKKSAYF